MLKSNLRSICIFFSAALIIFIGTACQSNYQYQGALLEPSVPMPDFELTAADGSTFRLSETKGDINLIYFGYANCPDVCPLTMWDVKTALNGLESGRERVNVVFISVDPERDTPEILKTYMAAFGPEFIGLSDDYDKVQEVMKPYGAFAEKEELEDSALGYTVSHTARLFLIDPQGNLLLQYPFGFKAEELQSDLAHLLKENSS